MEQASEQLCNGLPTPKKSFHTLLKSHLFNVAIRQMLKLACLFLRRCAVHHHFAAVHFCVHCYIHVTHSTNPALFCQFLQDQCRIGTVDVTPVCNVHKMAPVVA